MRAIAASPAFLQRPDTAAVARPALAVPGAARVVFTLSLAYGNQADHQDQAKNALHGGSDSSEVSLIIKNEYEYFN